MMLMLKKWFFTRYRRAVNSIAFYPVFISLSLAVLSFIIYAFRQNSLDKWVENAVPFLKNSDADSIRSLMNVVAGGSISISVFSFSMVMVVLSQASQTYSPKILDGLTKNKTPQRILGFYIGTVVFCLPQMLLIGDDYERAISPIAILIAVSLAVLNMFFFIEFIDYISNSIKPNQICRNIYKRSQSRLINETKEQKLENDAEYIYKEPSDQTGWKEEGAIQSGYFQGLDHQDLYDLCKEAGIQIKLAHQVGVQVLSGQCLFYFKGTQELDDDLNDKIHSCFHFYDVEDIEKNFFYGFRELAEIGAKALSPGVNDIGTARISLDLLIDLISEFVKQPKKYGIATEGNLVIHFYPVSLHDIFEKCLDEIRIYAVNDKNIMLSILNGCKALMQSNPENKELHNEVKNFMKKVLHNIKNTAALNQDANYLLEYYEDKVAPLLD